MTNSFEPQFEDGEANILVDFQIDFIDGTMAVNGASSLIEKIVMLTNAKPTIATQDSHPPNHLSFASNNNSTPGNVIKLNGVDQILWPDHCIQGTFGWQLEPRVSFLGSIDRVFFKGTDYDIDSYSGFYDNARLIDEKLVRKTTGLHEYLQTKDVKRLYIFGLATDYCVKFTVLDALKLGYIVYFVHDASAAVNLSENDGKNAITVMEEAGANIVSTKEVLEMQ